MFYLVDWGNGYIGGYDNKFNQQFNTDKESIIDDLKRYKIDTVKIISSDELNKLRGYKKPSLEEYLAGLTS